MSMARALWLTFDDVTEQFVNDGQLCADLGEIGVDCHAEEHEQEKLIRIVGRPIRWAKVVSSSRRTTRVFVIYAVPDSRPLPALLMLPKWDWEKQRLYWHSEREGAQIALRLNGLDIVDSHIIADKFTAIETSVSESSWLIVQRLTWNLPVLRWENWDACERIAKSLLLLPLAASSPS